MKIYHRAKNMVTIDYKNMVTIDYNDNPSSNYWFGLVLIFVWWGLVGFGLVLVWFWFGVV